MKTAIECYYKGVKEIKPGSFTNSDGKNIEYKGSYKIIIDQLVNGVAKETELKIPKELALNTVTHLKIYDKIVLNLDITIYSSNVVSIKIVSVEKK